MCIGGKLPTGGAEKSHQVVVSKVKGICSKLKAGWKGKADREMFWAATNRNS